VSGKKCAWNETFSSLAIPAEQSEGDLAELPAFATTSAPAALLGPLVSCGPSNPAAALPWPQQGVRVKHSTSAGPGGTLGCL